MQEFFRTTLYISPVRFSVLHHLLLSNSVGCTAQESKLNAVQGRAKERELSFMRQVPSGLIGCPSAGLSYWVAEEREIQTVFLLLLREHHCAPSGSISQLT